MTNTLQIGDIVRIDEPTADDIVAMNRVGYEYAFKDYVGRLAVVTSLEIDKHTKVRLVLCDEDYTFDKEDTYKLYWSTGIYTVDSHLSLVHKSILRTHVVDDASQHGFAGSPLPFIGSQMPCDVVLGHEYKVVSGSRVRGLVMYSECFRIVFYHEDGITAAYALPVDHIVEPKFTTF